MFGLLKKSKPQQDKQRNQRKRQNKFDDDEKWVRSGDRPFIKAKRSNRDMFDQNELQTYFSLEKMLHKNQIKCSSDERVMQFTKPVIFSSREFGPYGSQAHVLILTTMDQNDQNEPG
ncbi:hypothetical protein DY000_02020854 [Brassica cretica]|uniref:Uncharacterized protein n=1 Tax=Brassica cretica TaxID=69181 RepID=A0ABQ7EHG1_BRACR|nr:hypothetical protein DY000_02020854 [Brassica cretica]